MAARTILITTTLTAALAFAGAHAAAHGGSYNGPGGQVSPGSTPPGSPTAPSPTPSPYPTTPVPGASSNPAATPTPGSPYGTPGASPVAPSASRPNPAGFAGGVTRRNRSRSASFTDWDFWWGFNKDRFLNLKDRLYRSVESESASFFMGRVRGNGLDTSRPSRAFVERHLIPTLKKALESDSSDVRDSACVALGKVGGAAEVPVLAAMIKDSTRSVREGAVIGLGLLECEAAIPALMAVLRGDRAGRKLRGGREPEARLRAFAATSLGLIPHTTRSAEARSLLLALSADETENRNITVNCTIALGLLRGDATSLAPVLQHLDKVAKSSARNAWNRAHALIALARVHEKNELDRTEALLRDVRRLVRRDRNAHVRRSAIQALGILERGTEQVDTLKALRSALDRGRDAASRHFAAIALGEVGGEIAFKSLRDAAVGERNQRGVFGAIGLAILLKRIEARGRTNGHEGSTEQLAHGLRALRTAFRRNKNPKLQGGFAIALGIADDRKSGDLLLTAMKHGRDTTVRGYLAIAMGMIDHRPARTYLTTLLAESTNLPLLKQQVAIGLGLMGSRTTVRALLTSLTKARSTYALGSITKALGFIGDRSAIKPLTDMLANQRSGSLTRGFACVALGSIADARALPTLSRLATHHNYLANTGALNELLDIL